MEFVTGTLKISALNEAIGKKLILTSFIVGFAGLSVHAQVMAVISKYNLSLKPYIFGKLLHGIIAALYTMLYLYKFPITSAVFEPSMSRAFAASSLYESAFAVSVVLGCIIFAVILFVKEQRAARISAELRNKF